MNGTEQTLLALAYNERNTLGFINTPTRDALMDAGYTAATLEAALINMERN